jgi:ANTAR domain/GAF domain
MAEPADHGAPDDVLSDASAVELLSMAARTLVRRGADMATAQLLVTDGLLLVGHIGLGGRFAEHFALVDGATTACSEAHHTALPVEVPDVADHPIFNGSVDQEVMLRAGSRSCTSVPVFGQGRAVGVISAHYRTPGAHDARPQLAIASRLTALIDERPASLADAATSPAVEALHLRRALGSRTVIGTAKGMLMKAMDVSEDDAFAVLVRASQRENLKLREISARIVARHRTDSTSRRGSAGR